MCVNFRHKSTVDRDSNGRYIITHKVINYYHILVNKHLLKKISNMMLSYRS